MGRWILVPLLFALVFCACEDSKDTEGSPSSADGAATTSEIASSAPLVPGSQIKVGGVIITLNEIIDPYLPANEFSRPQAGQRFVAANVTLQNESDTAYDFNAGVDWHLQTADETRHNVDFAALTDPFLGTGQLPVKGDTARGWVAFSLPEGAQIKNLQFQTLLSTNQGRFVAP